MRLVTLKMNEGEEAALALKTGLLPIKKLNAAIGTDWPATIFELITSGRLRPLTERFNAAGQRTAESIDGQVHPKDAVLATLAFDASMGSPYSGSATWSASSGSVAA